jgi:hypothetical protein
MRKAEESQGPQTAPKKSPETKPGGPDQ